jgi:hypothetical protein
MSTDINPTEQTDNATTGTPTTPPTPTGAAVWTVDRVRALGVTTTLGTAASVLGISRSQAYRLAAINAFPTPVIRVGTRIVVPVLGLLNLVLVDPHPDLEPGDRRLDPDPESSVDATTRPPADYTDHRWRHRTEHPGDDE